MSFILEQIYPHLLQVQNSSQTNILFKTPFKVLLLEKKDVYYVTDGHIIIQAIMITSGDKQRNDLPKPVNRIRTNYYNFTSKISGMFKFTEEDCLIQDHPSPYYPEFHFQDRMSNIAVQNQPDFSNLQQVLIVKQWGIRIVNISNTGYYGVVLEIYSYERRREKYEISPSLHSVLYERKLSNHLEILRVKEMKKEIKKPLRANYISLCYYRKNIKAQRVNKSILSNFVTVDKNGKILKSNSSIKLRYLPFGNISGVLRFIRPLMNYSENKKTIINFNLFHGNEKTRFQDQDSEIDMDVEDEDKNEKQQREERELREVEDKMIGSDCESDFSLSESEEEDPLKFIYARQLEKLGKL